MLDVSKIRQFYANSMLGLSAGKVKPVYYKIGDTEHLYAHRSIYATPSELYSDKTLDTDERFVSAPMLGVFDAVRYTVGSPINITSGRRSQAKQEYLLAKGYKAAKTSPHVFGVALDIAVPGAMDDEEFADLFCDISEICIGSTPRVGYLSYRKNPDKSSSFIHIDYAPLIYIDSMPDSWKNERARW